MRTRRTRRTRSEGRRGGGGSDDGGCAGLVEAIKSLLQPSNYN